MFINYQNMKVFTIIYVVLLPLIYARTYVLDLSPRGFEEPVNNQVEKASQNYVPVEGFLQVPNDRKSSIGQQTPPTNDYKEHITTDNVITTTVPRSNCKYWSVDPDNNNLVEHSGICPVDCKVCPVTDVKLPMPLPREDDLHVPLPVIAKEEPCIISAEVLEDLLLYHNRIDNGNVSTIQMSDPKHHRVSVTTRGKHFEDSSLFGHYKEDFLDKPYKRPIFHALYLAFKIGTLVKVFPYIPFISKDPARDLYSHRYIDYDTKLLKDVLEKKKYKSLLLSRIARHV